jgi:uncharacterized surface protein with fasciclin (FAS1) repeats
MLPQDLKSSLAKTQGKQFSNLLQKEGLLKDLTGRSKMTLFAIPDSSSQKEQASKSTLERFVYDGLAYSPDLSDGKCLKMRGGGTVSISRQQGGDILVNGAKITKSDVIVKNGVVHYVEKVTFFTQLRHGPTADHA